QGFKITTVQREQFYHELSKMNSEALNTVENEMYDAYYHYRNLRWNYIITESCNDQCQYFKSLYYDKKRQFDILIYEENQKLSLAKSKLGIMSEYGVDETRTLFQNSFNFGKRIAKRQTQWDFFWYAISSISRSRDETILAY